jgi:hypothetical protein
MPGPEATRSSQAHALSARAARRVSAQQIHQQVIVAALLAI